MKRRKFLFEFLRNSPNASITPQIQRTVPAIQTPIAVNQSLSQPQKFVIVKPGINIQQQVKPNIVVMNPPMSNTQVSFPTSIWGL